MVRQGAVPLVTVLFCCTAWRPPFSIQHNGDEGLSPSSLSFSVQQQQGGQPLVMVFFCTAWRQGAIPLLAVFFHSYNGPCSNNTYSILQ